MEPNSTQQMFSRVIVIYKSRQIATVLGRFHFTWDCPARLPLIVVIVRIRFCWRETKKSAIDTVSSWVMQKSRQLKSVKLNGRDWIFTFRLVRFVSCKDVCELRNLNQWCHIIYKGIAINSFFDMILNKWREQRRIIHVSFCCRPASIECEISVNWLLKSSKNIIKSQADNEICWCCLLLFNCRASAAVFLLHFPHFHIFACFIIFFHLSSQFINKLYLLWIFLNGVQKVA